MRPRSLCLVLCWVGLLVLLTEKAVEGAVCGLDVVGHKYETFVQKELQKRAAAARKEGDRVQDLMEETQPAPIRIKLVTQLEGSYLDEPGKKRLAEQIAPGAVAIIKKYVQVRLPRKYSIRMPRPSAGSKEGMCNDAYAAPLWEKGGVRGYDLVLFVTANHTKDCKLGALAYTLPCLTDMVTGRPTAAGMNICPLSQRSSPQRLLNTVVHELVHALGFSGQLFPLYYDSRTWNPYKKADQVAIEFEGGLNRSSPSSIYIAFPALRKLAQDHFACPSLPGAPADVGSFASHFKQRVMGHELMMPATSEDGQRKEITEFTLTLLESTGWYKANMKLAQPALFGKGAGCELVKETCEAYIKRNPAQNYYCSADQKDVDQCTYDYQGIGVCVESVDDNCLLSGASQLRGATLMCGSSSSWSTMRHQAFLYHHQAFGGTVGSDSSRCYALEGAAKVCRSSGKGNGTTTCLLRNAMCIDTVCGAKGSVSAVFKFDNGQDVTVPCPSGKSIKLAEVLPGRGFTSGSLRCPDARVVCPQLSCKKPCVNGRCFKGRCICDMEFTGESCDKNLVPGW